MNSDDLEPAALPETEAPDLDIPHDETDDSILRLPFDDGHEAGSGILGDVLFEVLPPVHGHLLLDDGLLDANDVIDVLFLHSPYGEVCHAIPRSLVIDP